MQESALAKPVHGQIQPRTSVRWLPSRIIITWQIISEKKERKELHFKPTNIRNKLAAHKNYLRCKINQNKTSFLNRCRVLCEFIVQSWLIIGKVTISSHVWNFLMVQLNNLWGLLIFRNNVATTLYMRLVFLV